MNVDNYPDQVSSKVMDMASGTTKGWQYDQTLDGYLAGAGTTVPADAATGWAKGCIFIHTDGANNFTLLYVNVGSGASANFDPISSAALMSIADSGSLITGTTVEAALAEIFQHAQSIQKVIDLPLLAYFDGQSTNALLSLFGNGDTTPAGFTNLSSEGLGIRWNNKATQDQIWTSFVKPNDFDATANAVLHIIAVRSATDATDLVTFDVTAFENNVGAAAGADADFGGTSSAMADNVLIQEVTLAFALANLSSSPGQITLSIEPTEGILATVDVTILGTWLEYKGKILTS